MLKILREHMTTFTSFHAYQSVSLITSASITNRKVLNGTYIIGNEVLKPVGRGKFKSTAGTSYSRVVALPTNIKNHRCPQWARFDRRSRNQLFDYTGISKVHGCWSSICIKVFTSSQDGPFQSCLPKKPKFYSVASAFWTREAIKNWLSLPVVITCPRKLNL